MSGSVEDSPASCCGAGSIQVTVRSVSGSRDFTVRGDCTVTQFKRDLKEQLGASEDQLVLIQSGRVLTESEVMSNLKGQNESVSLCLIQRPPHSLSPPTDDPASGAPQSELPAVLEPDLDTVLSPPPTSPLCLVEGLNSLDLESSGSGLFPALQHQMESQLLADPQMLCRILSSPLVQDTLFTSSPELIRQLIQSNPQIQQLMQTTPEVLEFIRNPDMLEDFIQTEDRTLEDFQPEQENLETTTDDGERRQTPEGKAEYRRLSLSQSRAGERTVETSCGKQQTPEGESDPTPASFSHSTDPLRGFNATSTTQANTPFAITAGMQSLLEEITASPGLVETLLSGPSVCSLLNCLSQNPDLAAQMLLSHPLFSGNPQLQQQMRQQIPLFLQQMQSPELLSAMLNPRALEALLQIQHGLQTLAAEAPALIPAAGLGHIGTSVKGEVPEPVLGSQSGSGPQVATVTEQQQQFVQQMLQTLANSSKGVCHEEL